MKRKFTFLLIVLGALATCLHADLSTEEIIKNARDYLGGDDKLKEIQTLHYVGSFEAIDNSESGQLEIYLKKPMQQRVEVKNTNVRQITVYDDYDSWVYSINLANNQKNLQFQGVKEIKRGRANTWENLNFFRGIETMFGTIINKGLVQKDGSDAYLLVFQYDEDIYFERYFDATTFAIISTLTPEGEEIRELGEMIVNGIKFPRTVVRLIDGQPTNTITFEQIFVNTPLDSTLFELPSFLADDKTDSPEN